MEFDWDDANILHLARHNITPEEAEQAIRNDSLLLESQVVDGEVRSMEIGITDRGRILTLVLTEKSPALRVITGWDASRKEQMIYLQTTSMGG